MSRPRVAIAGVFHETNTFSPLVTDLAAFERKGLLTGAEIVDTYGGTRTVVGGFLAGAAEHGLDVVPAFTAHATPSGPVTAEAFTAISDRLADSLRAVGPVDGVLLELHGALAVEGVVDAEDDLVALVRSVVGEVPVAAVTDLHANMATPRLGALTIHVGYRTNPHVDTFERGADAAGHLAAVLAGRLDPVRAHRGAAVVAVPAAQRTAAEPMAAIVARARELESELGLVDVTVHGGYAYGDVPHLGMGFSVTADASRAADAERAAADLQALAREQAPKFDVDLPGVAVAFGDALTGDGPVAIADTGDNINGGTPGDTTWLLTEAVRHPDTAVLATLCDPVLVRTAASAGVGATVTTRAGGWSGDAAGTPLSMRAEVVALGDGTFVNTGPMSTGAVESMGPVAVVRVGRCDIVVQSVAVQPNDPEMFRSVGLDPSDYRVILLKGAAAIRAGWGDLVSRFVDCGTPGFCDPVLSRLSYLNGPLAGRRAGADR